MGCISKSGLQLICINVCYKKGFKHNAVENHETCIARNVNF